jgi:hypothetical protein
MNEVHISQYISWAFQVNWGERGVGQLGISLACHALHPVYP